MKNPINSSQVLAVEPAKHSLIKKSCKYCQCDVYSSNTTNYRSHLHHNHPAIIYAGVQDSSVSSSSDLNDAESQLLSGKSAKSPVEKRKRQVESVDEVPQSKLHQKKLTSSFICQKYVSPYPAKSKFKKLLDCKLIFTIVRDFYFFSLVEDKGFLEFVAGLDHRYTVPSRRTLVRSLLPEAHAAVLTKLKTLLNNVE